MVLGGVIPRFLLLSVAVGLSGCYASVGDNELEARISEYLATDAISIIDNMDQMVVTMDAPGVFNLSEEDQFNIAESIAKDAVEIKPDRRLLLIVFSERVSILSFQWENMNGKLKFIGKSEV